MVLGIFSFTFSVVLISEFKTGDKNSEFGFGLRNYSNFIRLFKYSY